MSKYFAFMYVDDDRLRRFLNLAIYVLNPQERWPAHVTISGPFDRRVIAPRSLKFVQQISIIGRGRFDNDSRHTVYLRVGSIDLPSRMEKPDFPDAVPHLSIYSGKDKELADLLYHRLSAVRLFGVFYCRELEIVESGQQHSFNFSLQVDTSVLEDTKRKSLEDIKKLSKQRRVNIAVKALRAGFSASLKRSARIQVLKLF